VWEKYLLHRTKMSGKAIIFASMEKQVILNNRHFELTLNRLCYQLIETHHDFANTVLIGLQPRGVNVVSRLKSQLEAILGHSVTCGNLDITFYRDDFRRRERPIIPSVTNIDFVIEGKNFV
jgi:pyrimidine operon attenuation protein/uracil phosphoribosyltransferase